MLASWLGGCDANQDPPLVTSAITCSGGSRPSEVGWSLSCSDGTTLSGGAPYPSSSSPSSPLAVALGATCTLDMTDSSAETYSYGDGWDGAEWAAPGFGQSFSLPGVNQGTRSFVVQYQPPPSPPPPPPPSPPLPSPSLPPSPPSSPQVTSAITCSSGSYGSEVSWSLSCSDGTTLSAARPEGAPYTSSVPLAVAIGATCTLTMEDQWSDGWNGAEWAAPGFGQSFSLEDGPKTDTRSFVVQYQPPPSPPPPPPPSPPL
eukprot:scaffold120395_cov54-Phaeocystis_antarctica.AAC.1